MGMKYSDWQDYVNAAKTSEDLEFRFQEFLVAWRNRGNRSVDKLTRDIVEQRGRELAGLSPLGRFIPAFGPRRALTVCGEKYTVAKGGNSTGVRYAWCYAKEWAVEVMKKNDFPFDDDVLNIVWSWALSYPHRALLAMEKAVIDNT